MREALVITICLLLIREHPEDKLQRHALMLSALI